MNEEQMKGNWKQLSAKFKEKWGKLTDNEITEAEGRVEFLTGKVQEHYGQTKEQASKEINDFVKTLK